MTLGPAARWFSWGLCFGFSSSLDRDPTVCVGAGVRSSKDRQCLAGGGARGRLPGWVGCSDAGLASKRPQGHTPPTRATVLWGVSQPEAPTPTPGSVGAPLPACSQGSPAPGCLGSTGSFFFPQQPPSLRQQPAASALIPPPGPVASDCHPSPCPGSRDLAFTPWSSRTSWLRAVPPPQRRARPSPGHGPRCSLWPDLASKIWGVS